MLHLPHEQDMCCLLNYSRDEIAELQIPALQVGEAAKACLSPLCVLPLQMICMLSPMQLPMSCLKVAACAVEGFRFGGIASF